MLDDDDGQLMNVASSQSNMISEAVGPGEDHEMTVENNSHNSSDLASQKNQLQQNANNL